VTGAGLAVVTGGAGGLGRAIARRVGEAGSTVLLVDRDDRLEDVRDELAGDRIAALVLRADLGDADAPHAIAQAVQATGLALRLLVNNAGITRDGRAEQLADEDFAGVIGVNLVAALRLAIELRPLLAAGGSVVNLSSRAALGNFGQANYVAAKAGLIGATRSLALRWAPDVRVNAVAPGLIDTPMTGAMPDAVRDKLVARVPLGRIGTPDDVAGVVAFLAGEDARYVTGQVLLCCGGRSVAP
jgi:NAD(P)-dependent dehydrogenase (short-subunit alcohol dehydrogenase family)